MVYQQRERLVALSGDLLAQCPIGYGLVISPHPCGNQNLSKIETNTLESYPTLACERPLQGDVTILAFHPRPYVPVVARDVGGCLKCACVFVFPLPAFQSGIPLRPHSTQ